jgi:hypothetical protein
MNEARNNPALSVYNTLSEPVFKFNFETSTVDSLYIDKNLSAYWISNGALYHDVLSIDHKKFSTNITENVNKYLYSKNSVLIGDWVDIVVDIPRLYLETGSSTFMLSTIIDGELKYLHTEYKTLVSEKYITDCKEITSLLEFSILLESSEEIIFNLVTPERTYRLNLSPHILYSRNGVPIDDHSLLYIKNSELKVSSYSVDYEYNYDSTVTFVWDGISDLDFEISTGKDVIGTNINTFENTVFSKLFLDGNNTTESYLYSLEQLKKDYKGEWGYNCNSLPLTLKVSLGPNANILKATVISCFVLGILEPILFDTQELLDTGTTEKIVYLTRLGIQDYSICEEEPA